MADDRWRVDLLARDGTVKQTLPRVTAGQLEWSIFKSVGGSGDISWTADPGVSIDWLTDRLAVWHIDEDGAETPWGVWLVTVPGWDTDRGRTTTTIKLADRCEALNAPIGRWLTHPEGTGVVAAVVAIVTARGESAMSVTPSDAVTRTAQTWEPSDTWLTVVNDLLGQINYGSIWADRSGFLRIEPYILPADRPVVGAFGGGPDDLLMRPVWSDEADIFALPTGVRIDVQGDEKTPGFTGVADLPDAHALSAASRGRDQLLTETEEAADQATADAIAVRRLQEALQVTRRVSVTHPVDDTDMGDVVRHRPLGLEAAIVTRRVRLGAGAVVEDSIRHIYTGGELPWPVR